jgi:HEPN domain-containing protein
MINDESESSFHHAKVVVALFDHALELFLKGAIIQANKPIGNTHHLQELYNQFRNLYSGKIFEFEGDITNAVRNATITPYNQYARYPTDLGGKTSQMHTHIELVTWYRQIRRFARDLERLEPLLKQRYPKSLESTG